jgi:uncharacterized membrane protein
MLGLLAIDVCMIRTHTMRRNAHAYVLLAEGIPIVYYGAELGMLGMLLVFVTQSHRSAIFGLLLVPRPCVALQRALGTFRKSAIPYH